MLNHAEKRIHPFPLSVLSHCAKQLVRKWIDQIGRKRDEERGRQWKGEKKDRKQ